ncbi:transcriptional regulator [Pseudogracilibacillus auburnensis]|uniref:transcriptional regulator n=1 Tax=Pseudogracilibacillus auburnensis TaxID=1494959 RepID=UPI001A969A91|nr:transcriptional regulator [Pseudogracilibacillus auburnensis]MBO1005241.1 transcriptional regulator [Pseudogracilibacillus auburnensis]
MRNELIKYVKRCPTLVIMYMDDKGIITKRTVRVLKMNSSTFTAYCYLRNARRTFKINNLLAIIPITERAVI